MKKNLIILSLALALGAHAASYSANVIGFVKVNVGTNMTLVADPFITGVTNGANEVLPTLADGTGLLLWNPAIANFVSYTVYQGHYYNSTTGALVPTPVLGPGQGFFIKNFGAATNVTFAGSLAILPGKTNYISLPVGYTLVGSEVPTPGGIKSKLGLTLPSTATLQFYTNGVYSQYTYSSGQWYNTKKSVVPEPVVFPGQGFFFENLGTAAVIWPETLPH